MTSPNSCANLRTRLAGQPLDDHELLLLRLLVDGANTADMAAATGSPPGTVRTALRRVYAKLGARNSVQAVGLATARGLVLAHITPSVRAFGLTAMSS